jgi:RNA polymerase sigma-70 factor, ECF subfamily
VAVTRRRDKLVREEADERLLVEAAQRDLRRFGELYELYFERIYAFLVHRVRDRHIAEDLTSEVFHKALAALPEYEWRGVPFAAWLIRIAVNAVADQRKRSYRETLDADPPSPVESPNFDAMEARSRLFRFVNGLPSDQRHVVFERFVEQRSIREIAQQLGKTEGAVKQLQLRALKTLRAQVEAAHA